MKLEKIVNSTKKIITISLLVGTLAFPIENVQAEQEVNKAKRVYISLKFGINLGYNLKKACRVSNIPEYVRNVPAHPKDSYFDIAPIEDTELKYPPFHFNFESYLGLGYTHKSYNFQAGGGLTYILSTIPNIKKRNYTNAPGTEQRGYGAALTYYGFSDGISDGLSAITPKLYFKLLKFYKISKPAGWKDEKGEIENFLLEYNIDFFNLDIETGWDRWDRLESRKRYKLADITRHTIKFGMENICRGEGIFDSDVCIKMFVGYVIQDAKLTSLGKQSNLKLANYWIIGANFLADIDKLIGK